MDLEMPRNRLNNIKEFKEGEFVQAKFPGTNAFYPATLIKLRNDNEWEVKFADQSTHVVPARNIENTTKSSANTKSSHRSRSKSPSRRKASSSASRSRSRSRTSGRRSNSSNSNKKNHANAPKSPSKTPTRVSVRLINHQNKLKGEKLEVEDIKDVPEEKKKIILADSTDSQPKTPLSSPSVGCLLLITLLTLLTPVFVLWVTLSCDQDECSASSFPKLPLNPLDYIDSSSVAIYTGWLVFQFALAVLPIGEVVEGQSLDDGSRLRYRINGLQSLFLTMAVAAGLIYYNVPLDIIFDKYLQLVISSIFFSLLISFFLVFRTAEKSVGSSFIYDFFVGRELNPLIWNFNLKFFLVFRPGLIGWAVINIAILWEEFQNNNFYPSIWFVGISQLIYILDIFIFEESLLTTRCITKDELGFKTVFGSLTFVPFIFTLPVRYLLLYRPSIKLATLIAIFLLNVIGYIIYRGSNKQKNDFRISPYQAKFLKAFTIHTEYTQKLLADGWWSYLRHPNYLGDLIIGLSWCLPCGSQHIIPYFHFIYLLLFLVHRARQDDRACQRKYGNAWKQYCNQVSCRMIPFVY